MEGYTTISIDCRNSSQDKDYCIFLNNAYLINLVVNSLLVSSGVPLCAVAVCVLYSLVRHGGAPALVYVFNLLISDIVQIICLFVTVRPFDDLWKIYSLLDHIHSFCLLTSVAFMTCIALERYLLIVWPLWYRFKRPTRISAVVSVLVWILCAAVSVVLYSQDFVLSITIFNILFLLPVPLFIFCLAATLRALSACRLPADEKRRIVAVLVLVLVIHTLLFLPTVVTVLTRSDAFYNLPIILLRLNPLADLVLCSFMQKGAVDKPLASVCCCRLNSDSSIPSA
ncbi:uncharacterized protein V6R79_002701 [Siganus canaliculatus]